MLPYFRDSWASTGCERPRLSYMRHTMIYSLGQTSLQCQHSYGLYGLGVYPLKKYAFMPYECNFKNIRILTEQTFLWMGELYLKSQNYGTQSCVKDGKTEWSAPSPKLACGGETEQDALSSSLPLPSISHQRHRWHPELRNILIVSKSRWAPNIFSLEKHILPLLH